MRQKSPASPVPPSLVSHPGMRSDGASPDGPSIPSNSRPKLGPLHIGRRPAVNIKQRKQPGTAASTLPPPPPYGRPKGPPVTETGAEMRCRRTAEMIV